MNSEKSDAVEQLVWTFWSNECGLLVFEILWQVWWGVISKLVLIYAWRIKLRGNTELEMQVRKG